MKFWIIVLSGCTIFMMGQARAQQETEVSVSKIPFIPYLVGGVNRAGITGVDDRSDVGSFATFNAGVGFLTLINHSRPMSLTVEALFSEQGYKINNVSRNSGEEYIKLRYIHVPAVLRFNFSQSSNLYFGIGPQVGFLVGDQIISKGGDQSNFRNGTLNKTVFDAVGTLGTYFKDHADMGIELRFQGGLSKFRLDEPQYRHSVLQIRLMMPMFFL